MVIAILQNISLITMISVIYHYLARSLQRRTFAIPFVNGVLFGSVAILAMLSPVRFSNGIIYDGRTIILAVAGLFGGPIAAGIATAMALFYRVFVIGGIGYIAGATTIVTASAVGLASYYWRKRGWKRFTSLHILFIGYLVHAIMLAAQLLLPNQNWKAVLPVIALPVLTLYPLAFFLICMLFLDDEERTRSRAMLEESEARYRLLFQTHRSIMILIDSETGKIIDVNLAAEQFYGWTREEMLRKTISEINTLPSDEVARLMRQVIAHQDSTFIFKHRLASGAIRDVEVFAGPIEYMGKKVICSIIHDATARIKAENEVRELNQSLELQVARRTRELQETNAELESFAYSVSHDLRAPLRALEGFSSLLIEEGGNTLSGTSRHYIERIQYNAKKMSQLIDDLLRLSRISRQTLEYSQVDLSRLARDIAEEIAASNPDRKVSFFAQDGMSAKADRALLEVALNNLFGNAWKFTSEVPEAVIRFESEERDGETVYSVSDNGVGFDMAYADKLFTPFMRLHSEKEYSGSGIGLSIVRRIISRHGGRIWAKAAPNEGTTFYFTIGGR